MSAHKLYWFAAGLFVSGPYASPPRDSFDREENDVNNMVSWSEEAVDNASPIYDDAETAATPEDGGIAGEAIGDPCSEAGEVFDGDNDLASFPINSLGSFGACRIDGACGVICDPWCCTPYWWTFRWANYVAPCTAWIEVTPYLVSGEEANSPMLFPTCCPHDFTDALVGCPTFWRGGVTVPVLRGNCYKIAVFGAQLLRIESIVQPFELCVYSPGAFFDSDSQLDSLAAFVSCQNDCTSPACSQCFDVDADDDLDLRDFALLQNTFPWF